MLSLELVFVQFKIIIAIIRERKQAKTKPIQATFCEKHFCKKHDKMIEAVKLDVKENSQTALIAQPFTQI